MLKVMPKVYIRYAHPEIKTSNKQVERRSYVLLTFENTEDDKNIPNEFEDAIKNVNSTLNEEEGRGEAEAARPNNETLALFQDEQFEPTAFNTLAIFVNYKTDQERFSQGYSINEVLNHCVRVLENKYQIIFSPNFKAAIEEGISHIRAEINGAFGLYSSGKPDLDTHAGIDAAIEAIEAHDKGVYTAGFMEFYQLDGRFDNEGRPLLKSIGELIRECESVEHAVTGVLFEHEHSLHWDGWRILSYIALGLLFAGGLFLAVSGGGTLLGIGFLALTEKVALIFLGVGLISTMGSALITACCRGWFCFSACWPSDVSPPQKTEKNIPIYTGRHYLVFEKPTGPLASTALRSTIHVAPTHLNDPRPRSPNSDHFNSSSNEVGFKKK